MRRAAVLSLLGVLALGCLPARAQPPSGIVRPRDEHGLAPIELGRQLFAGNCSSCHGSLAQGITSAPPKRGIGDATALGPSLRGVGARALDFYLSTGRMPLADARDEPERGNPDFSSGEVRAIIAYVSSLGKPSPPGPPVPDPHPEQGLMSDGLHLFTEHCAGCHQVVAQGGVVTGARVPGLQEATAPQIAEAVRVGPYLMPHFSGRQISDAQLDSIIRYVLSTRRPPDRGGWGIGNIGPIPEGMVTWLLAVVVLVGVCVLLGKRVRP
jgi:ubiquinol-cytochrome c reductase cytochrome c subunit